MKKPYFKSLFFFILILGISQLAFGQSMVSTVESPTSAKINRRRGLDMLKDIKSIIKQRYYDKNFRGIDIDERFDIAADRIKELDANWQIFRVIAQVVLEFNDSHTRFYPPGRANRVEYGFSVQMIGAKCFVVDVKKGSDAEKKGVKTGDQILAIGQYNPTRDNLWKINYILYALDPLSQLDIHTLDPQGKENTFKVEATFKSIKEREKETRERRKKKKESPYKCHEINSEVIACRLETFSVDKKYIRKMMEEIGNHKKLIFDLRGNRGGYVKIEEYLTGYFFDKDIKIADFVMRNKTKERTAKTQKEDVYKGELIVLIDSNSASASEVFSRVIQLEKRGKIIGDVSAGAVMTSVQVSKANVRGTPGLETFSFFGMNVTIADLIMSDGKRLENIGVIPDVPIGPSGTALAQKTDPILAYSAKLFGAELNEKEAGELHFLMPEPEDIEDEEQDEEENRIQQLRIREN